MHDIKPGGRIRKKSSIKKMLAMRKLDVNSGLLETITAKNTKRTLGPDQVCGIVCRGRIWKKMINNPMQKYTTWWAKLLIFIFNFHLPQRFGYQKTTSDFYL